jgi:DNA-binding MarR family transcriptional regulator
MSIEKDIQQSSFRNEHQKAMVNLFFTYSWAMEKAKSFFEKEGLTPQQFNILRILRGSTHPLSTQQIRERMLDKMSDTSRIVDRLLIKELVEKKVRATDKRLVDITISPKGRKTLEVLDAQNEALEAMMKTLTKEEAQQLNFLLDKLRTQ